MVASIKRIVAVVSLCVGFYGASAFAQTQSQPPVSQPGEDVVVVLHTVKPDKREQAEAYLEKFIRLLDAQHSSKRDPSRLLYPTEANDDGTFTYGFIIEKAERGKPYRMLDVLKASMPDAEAQKMLDAWLDSAVKGRSVVGEFVVKGR